MATHFRYIIFGFLLVALVGCGRAYGSFTTTTELVEEQTLTRQIRYYEDSVRNTGPLYNVTVTLPETWVGPIEPVIVEDTDTEDTVTEDTDTETDNADSVVIETRTGGNRIAFNLFNGRSRNPILYIDALSPSQYWEQIGSYPGIYANIVFTADTYFIYHSPINPSFAGLDEATYNSLIEQVPAIIESFNAERVP